jgi:hypothetical protein
LACPTPHELRLFQSCPIRHIDALSCASRRSSSSIVGNAAKDAALLLNLSKTEEPDFSLALDGDAHARPTRLFTLQLVVVNVLHANSAPHHAGAAQVVHRKHSAALVLERDERKAFAFASLSVTHKVDVYDFAVLQRDRESVNVEAAGRALFTATR